MKSLCQGWKDSGESVVFVPTMGALHAGHLSLVERAKTLGQRVVVSIFVNPSQFGPNEDFKEYPRTLERDLASLAPYGVDAVFLPNAADIYPSGFQTYVVNEGIGLGLCGQSRTDHFRGVCTVVLKLFNILRPDIAVFGKKDYQQWMIISKMVEDFHLDIMIEGVETCREEDGLALSSRNQFLSSDQRKLAVMLPVSLNAAYDKWDQGSRSRRELEKAFMTQLSEVPEFALEYVKVCDQSDLSRDSDDVLGPVVMLAAVKLGKVRLIDNIEFEWVSV